MKTANLVAIGATLVGIIAVSIQYEKLAHKPIHVSRCSILEDEGNQFKSQYLAAEKKFEDDMVSGAIGGGQLRQEQMDIYNLKDRYNDVLKTGCKE